MNVQSRKIMLHGKYALHEYQKVVTNIKKINYDLY